jgi:hypothetical protein
LKRGILRVKFVLMAERKLKKISVDFRIDNEDLEWGAKIRLNRDVGS